MASRKEDGLFPTAMVIVTVVMVIVFMVIGLALGMTIFQKVKPESQTLRNAAMWITKFYLFYMPGCVFSAVFTIVRAVTGGNKRARLGRKVMNVVIPLLVGVVLAVLMWFLYPAKRVSYNAIATTAIVLQGLLIPIIAALQAPPSWR